MPEDTDDIDDRKVRQISRLLFRVNELERHARIDIATMKRLDEQIASLNYQLAVAKDRIRQLILERNSIYTELTGMKYHEYPRLTDVYQD